MIDLPAQLEALLFVASEPVTIARLAEATEQPAATVAAALQHLAGSLAERGLQLQEHADTYRLVTHPAAAAIVHRFLLEETRTELSKPALETLAIIAYRGPLTKSQVEAIRGVTSDAMIRNLLQRGLVTEQGTAAEPGRPTLYGVSHAFLQHFGLAHLRDLPPVEDPAPREN